MDRPYATFIGVKVEECSPNSVLCSMPLSAKIAGDGGMLHAGALAGLLETAAGAMVEAAICDPSIEVLPVSITVDYVRAGNFAETHASAQIVRQGLRIVHIDAAAWQEDADRPIAMARLVFKLRHLSC